MATAYRSIFAVLAWLTLAVQYALMIGTGTPSDLFRLTLNFFSFFTILTNILVALALTASVVVQDRRLGRWAASEGVRAALTMYIVVVGIVYHVLLHPLWDPQGLLLIVNIALHYVMPMVFLIDWLAFTPKGRLRWIDPVKWLVFPIVYGVWTVAHGFAAHWWPYGFLNVEALGLARAVISLSALLIFFLIVGLGVVTIDRVFGRKARRDTGSASA